MGQDSDVIMVDPEDVWRSGFDCGVAILVMRSMLVGRYKDRKRKYHDEIDVFDLTPQNAEGKKEQRRGTWRCLWWTSFGRCETVPARIGSEFCKQVGIWSRWSTFGNVMVRLHRLRSRRAL